MAVINSYKLSKTNSEQKDIASANVPPIDVNPAGYFLRSIFQGTLDLNFTNDHISAVKLINPQPVNDEHPLYQESYNPSKLQNTNLNKKNIILLVMESVRSAETGFFSKNNQGATPNIDFIAKQADSFINHYSNSVLTVKSEFSMLCSVLDFSKGPPLSRRGKPLLTKCLPRILKEHGYKSFWFHGNEKSFFNRNQFFPLLGFDKLYDKEVILQEKANSEILGWGISDKDTLSYAFDILSQKEEPFFAQILTVSNHFPFDFNFEESSQESKDYSTVYNNFLRGIEYTDQQVGLFWKKFQNSDFKNNTILIITSDHGLWFREKGFEDIHVANEALFRVPLIIWDPSKNQKPSKSFDTVSSHVDITPTILTKLGIGVKDIAFMGENLYSEKRRELALMTGFGGYAVRNKDHFCFPSGGSNVDGYFEEKRVNNPHNIICKKNEKNILKKGFKPDTSTAVIEPPKEYRKIIEFNDISLLKGFIPQKNSNP